MDHHSILSLVQRVNDLYTHQKTAKQNGSHLKKYFRFTTGRLLNDIRTVSI